MSDHLPVVAKFKVETNNVSSGYLPIENNIRIYPNPSNEKITIDVPFKELIPVRIVDFMGQVVVKEFISERKDFNLKEGLYIIDINNFTKKVLVY